VTTDVYAVPTQQDFALPGIADVFVHAATQIHRAAAEIWPGEPVSLEGHVPSVTGYVHRARVGGRTLYAKTSILGVSLVSLLRGTCGSWPEVRQAQEKYVTQPDGLLAREAAQLRVLNAMDRPRVCAVAGIRHGVIFTEPVTGPSLGELLLVQPGDTHELLTSTFAELRPLHEPGASLHLGPGGVIGERSIAGTFLRKFNGLSGALYIDRLGAERCEPGPRGETVELMLRNVDRLRRLRMTLAAAEGPTLAYGDLKPEHVVFPDGPDGRPVLLDPGLLRASPMTDLAKLISRTVLFLAAHRPGAETASHVVGGLQAFAESQVVGLSGCERGVVLRGLLTLWLMDTVNILTTYLSAPAALPLPALGSALVDRAVPVSAFVDEVSEALANPAVEWVAWELALSSAFLVAS